MGKRKREHSIEKLHKELKKLKRRIRRNRRRHSDDCVEDRYSSRSRSRSWFSGTSQSSHSRSSSVQCLSKQNHSTDEQVISAHKDVSPQETEQHQDKDTETLTGTEIPEEIKKVLGEEGIVPQKKANDLHDSLNQRWNAILQEGMTTETRLSVTKKYDVPNNCQLLVPPKLNEEVAAAMNESGIKRDKRIREKQATMAVAISAIGQVLNNMLTQDNIKEIEALNDAARLLCDVYHSDTTTRRALILPGLNKDLREMLENSIISEYLFGDKLQDKVSACKAVKKSALELKNTPAKPKPPVKHKLNNNLNFRGPQRPQMPRLSGPKQKQRRQTYQQATPSNRSRRSPQRQHHRRQTRR